MNIVSPLEHIRVKLDNPPKELNLKIYTYKGIVDLISSYDDIKDYEEIQEKVRNLKPNNYFDNPYWELYHIVKPISMLVEGDQSVESRKYVVKDFNYFRNDAKLQEKIIDINLRFELVLYVAWEIFIHHIDNVKPLKTTFIFGNLAYCSIEEYIRFRNKFSLYASGDKITAFELTYLEKNTPRQTPPDIRNEFKEMFNYVDYNIVDENICCSEKRQIFIDSIPDDQDCIFCDTLMSYPRSGLYHYTSYLNCQNIFSLILVLLQKLKKGGIAYFAIADISTQLDFDIIAILSYFFESVYIFKTSLESIISLYKKIVCCGFKSSDGMLDHMTHIANQWYNISSACNVGLTFGLDINTYYVDRLLGYTNQIKKIKYFNSLEALKRRNIWIEMIEMYTSIEEHGNEIIKKLQERRLSNTLFYMRKYKIPSNIPIIQINENILFDSLALNITSITRYCLFIDNPNSMKSDLDIAKNFVRLQYSQYIINNYQSKSHNDLVKKINPYSTLPQIIEKKAGHKVNYSFICAYEIMYTFGFSNDDKHILKDLSQKIQRKEEILATLDKTDHINAVYKIIFEYDQLMFDIVTKACQRYKKVYIYYSTVHSDIKMNHVYIICSKLRPAIKEIVHIDMNACFKLVIERMLQWYQILTYFYQNLSALEDSKTLEQIKQYNADQWLNFYDFTG
jgi:hypothetical protein